MESHSLKKLLCKDSMDCSWENTEHIYSYEMREEKNIMTTLEIVYGCTNITEKAQI